MNKGIKVLLITLGSILILGGIGAGLFAILGDFSSNEPVEEITETHEAVEYKYNDDGTLKSEVYYENDVYAGQKDYYSANGIEYYTVFDKDNNEIESCSTEKNVAGSISKITIYKNHKLAEVIEYNYYDDFRTPSKKTVKTYEGEDEYAEKTYFDENGSKTQVVTYLNGEVTKEKNFTNTDAATEGND